MKAPVYRRTMEIGACFADPFANSEGAGEIDTFTIPEGRRRRVYRPVKILAHGGATVNPNSGKKGVMQARMETIGVE
jgi:hypothetical protein